MSALPTQGTCQYNGFNFNETTTTEGIEIRMIPDAADRTFIYNTYDITLRTVITGQPNDAAILAAVRALSVRGAIFVYTGKGFGGLTINTGKVRDVKWGPIPKVISFRPLGPDNACELKWQVQVAIPPCADASYQFAPLEYTFKVNYDIDRSGYTKRVYTGSLRIPQTWNRVGDRTLSDNADKYRDEVVPGLVYGFRRIPGSYTLSEDKCRLDFSVTDEEMPINIPPPGLIDAKANRGYSSADKGLRGYVGTIDAEYEVPKGGDPTIARTAFFNLVAQTAQSLNGAWPFQFNFSEPNVYGKQVSKFSVQYRQNAAGLQDILASGGIWTGVPDSNWKLWSASMAIPLGDRGSARLTFNTGDDTIVDLCAPSAINNTLRTSPVYSNTLRGFPPGLFPQPTLSNSWVDYTVATRVETDTGIVTLRTLPPLSSSLSNSGTSPNSTSSPSLSSGPKAPVNSGSRAGLGGLGSALGAAAGFGDPFFNPPPLPAAGPGAAAGPPLQVAWVGTYLARPVYYKPNPNAGNPDMPVLKAQVGFQQRVGAELVFFLTGYALRVGYPIPVPSLTDIAGVPLVPMNRIDRGEGFWQAVVGNVGVPLYGARWNMRFVLSSAPPVQDFPVAPNEIYGG